MPVAQRETPKETPSPLPPLPGKDVLTGEQWSILAAIADTVVPSFTSSTGNRLLQHPLRSEIYEAATRRIEESNGLDAGDGLVAEYLGESATAQPGFKENVSRLLGFYMDDTARNGLIIILKALNTRVGALFLTGYATPFDCLPIQTREKILQSWQRSRLPLLRGLHRSLTNLVKVFWIRTSPTLSQVLGYPRTPIHYNPPASSYAFQYLQIPPSHSGGAEVLETDAVIVGSGCGGAFAAKTLAEAGLKVIVIDKSYYWSPDHLPMSENDASVHLFANGGAYQSDDASMTVINGSTWGGGGTINWSASLQTQGYVRREWSERSGLSRFTSAEFQADLDAVCERMGVGTAAIEHNRTNQVLLEGARKLGWSAKPVPQNTGGEAHNCGHCTLGCGSCGKKGPTETFLPDAAKAGASFLEGFEVTEVLFEGSSQSDTRTVTGVKGLWTSRDGSGGVSGMDRARREVIIKAPKVLIAAGAMATPLLLLQSRLRNKHIGRHLHLHPASMLAAVWQEGVRPWEGPILTSVVNEFEDLDGEGHGVKLEATTMLPGWFLPLFQWQSALQWKEFAAKMKRMTGYISLARARYTGKVYPDPTDGRCRFQYSLGNYDRNHVLEGIARLAELVYVEGAQEIFATVPGLEPFVRPAASLASKIQVSSIEKPSSNDIEFQTWLEKLRKIGLPSPESSFAAAHQMGTCRMGTGPENSVTDVEGRVWGTKGFYICDSSVFPSASGVNPMITVMGISRGIARGIVEREAAAATVKAKL